jgi:hypothetical protein
MHLAVFMLVCFLVYSTALKMVVVCSSANLAHFEHTIWHYILEQLFIARAVKTSSPV